MDERDQKYDDLVSKYHEKCDLLLAVQWEFIAKAIKEFERDYEKPHVIKSTREEVAELHKLAVQMEEMEAEDAEHQGDSKE